MSVSTVKANINGQNYNLTYNGVSLKWEATITAPSVTSWNETNHKYNVTLTATDTAGNATIVDRSHATLGPSLQLRVLEKTKPTIALTSPSAGARVTNATPTISFQIRDTDSGIDPATLALKIDGGATIGQGSITCTSVAGGYNCTYTSGVLIEGSHTITINVSDNDGNAAVQLSSSFTVDTVPPSLNITNPTEGLITNNATITVSGTTNDATSSPVTVTIKLNAVDQGAVTLTAGAFSKNLTLAQGANTIIITTTDAAGLASSVTRHVTLDTTAPVISNITVTPNPADCGQTFIITVTVAD